MDISIKSSGSTSKLENFLRKNSRGSQFDKLSDFGDRGARALAAATPRDSGETAAHWDYKIVKGRGFYRIVWTNDHVVDSASVAILIQYGHGTGTGGYVPGKDYINPAMKPILDDLVAEGWKVVIHK